MPDVSTGLSFDRLPDLPQIPRLRRIVTTLWQRDDVIAIWLVGSLATGRGDHYCDLDLRIAIRSDGFVRW
jgi:predicted nucleotidyltransferase